MSEFKRQDARTLMRIYPVIGAMLLLSLLMYGSMSDKTDTVITFLTAPVVYFLAIYVCYGIAQLAFLRHNFWLWGGAVVSVSLSYLFLGTSQLWTVLTGWSMILFAGVLIGRLTLAGQRPRNVYIISLLAMIVFAIAQYFPLWQEILKSAPETTKALTTEAERQLQALGEGALRTQTTLDAFRRMVVVILRLVPAETVLSAIVQFSLAYLLFVRWFDKHQLGPLRRESFIYWKMPFGLMPIVMVVIVLRLIGGEMLALVADNVLLLLAVFYLVTGLAVIEYYQRKVQLSKLMRVMFYVMLFILPLANMTFSFIVGGIICLLGFIDSFADWRKIRLRGLTG